MGVEPGIFRSPNLLVMGTGAVERCGDEARQRGRQALVVCDPGIRRAGLVDPVTQSLAAAGVGGVVFDGVQPDPRMANVEAGVALARAEQCEIVIGVGGGSSLDVAKSVALVAGRGGTIRDYLGVNRIPGRGLPTILVPTTAGSGSEATAAVVLLDEADGIKKAAWSTYLLPDVALVDPLLTLSVPPAVTADTGIDVLVHAVEAFIGRGATPASDAMALAAIRLVSRHLVTSYRHPRDVSARTGMSHACTLAGLAFSSAGLGAVHALAYPVGEQYHVSHGRSNAIFLAPVLGFLLPACTEKLAQVAVAMGISPAGLTPTACAQRAVAACGELVAALEIPGRMRDYQVPRNRTDAMAAEAVQNGGRLLPNSPRSVGVVEAQAIYAAIW